MFRLHVVALALVACSSGAIVPSDPPPTRRDVSPVERCPTVAHCGSRETACAADAGSALGDDECDAAYFGCLSRYYYCTGNPFMGCLYACDVVDQRCDEACLLSGEEPSACLHACELDSMPCAASCS